MSVLRKAKYFKEVEKYYLQSSRKKLRMDRWVGRVALVTGASAGIGASIAEVLVKAGMKVVGCGRRLENIEKLSASLSNYSGKLYGRQCDLEKEEDIKDMFTWIENNQELGHIDVCVNNAGFSTSETLSTEQYQNWRKMLNVNVLGLCLCTQLSLQSMKKNNIDDGHVIMINSISGHRVPPNPSTRFYSATKFAVTALTEGWRQEVRDLKSNIRISALSPGLVETEFQSSMYPHDPEKARSILGSIKPLQSEDMSSAVAFILSAPAHMQVHDLIVRPTQQPF